MNKKIVAIIILLSIVVLGASGVYGYAYINTNKWTSLVYPGVKIEEVDLSGKTLVEAKSMITEKYGDAILKKNINIKTPLKTYSLNYKEINAKYNIDEVVEEAFNYGKDLNLYKRYKLITKPVSDELTLKFVYDSKPVNELITKMKKEIDTSPVDGSISRINGDFQITPDKRGAKLVTDKLEEKILSKINGDIKAPNIIVEAKVETTLANITIEKLQTINSKLSSFSSNFTTSSFGRSTNITLATNSINGTLLMPGQAFSFNGKVGERTSAKGYMPAPVDIGTKVSSDYGGGICQVSTSLYNTVIRANINSTERNHHSIPSVYIPLGMDATVDWGNLDYKFVNTLGYPIYIESIVENKILTFNVYSNSSLTNRTYNLVNDIYEAVPPGPTEYIDDPTLPIGTSIQDQFPLVGYKVRTFKDTIEDGVVINHQLVSDDGYQIKAEVIRLGTKKM
ncbi:VanW family protein [Clostridium sp.]